MHGYATAESNIDAISKIRKDFMASGTSFINTILKIFFKLPFINVELG